MAEGLLTMSATERDRSRLIQEVIEKKLRGREAAERLGVGKRQVKRLVRAWKRDGDGGLINRQRGRVPNNALPAAMRERLERLLREEYPDFGPTLAADRKAHV